MEGLEMSRDFWSGKRVFVTGHTGFKGSWLALWLQHRGAEVQGYALQPPTEPALFDVANVGRGMRSTIADIRDAAALNSSLCEFAPEIVFHLAAQSLVRLSYAQPAETYETNVIGTLRVLEAARQCEGVRCIVNVTTDKCYENREWVWGYREDEALGGYDPYSSSKACAELVTAAYRRCFFSDAGVALASARAGNVIGGGDWALDRLVPDVLRAMEKGQEPIIRNPRSTRPWQHVLEPVAGYMALAEALYENGSAFAEAWNFGPRDTDVRTVEWVCDELTQLWGGRIAWRKDGASTKVHEANLLKLDCSKAIARLSWRPAWSIQEALKHTVLWHRAWLSGSDMRAVCLEQIQAYEMSRAQFP
jgi:CDP-glucose 4,6-dehydratase